MLKRVRLSADAGCGGGAGAGAGGAARPRRSGKRAEASRLLAEHKKLVAEARARRMRCCRRRAPPAEKERALAMEKTRQEQEELLERARRDILAERDRALVELRREAVDLSLAAASKLIGERLTSETDRKIVQEYLAGLDTRH